MRGAYSLGISAEILILIVGALESFGGTDTGKTVRCVDVEWVESNGGV
jgi:hypothetical protein